MSVRNDVILLAIGTFMAVAAATPAAAQNCETIGCYTAECWWVGPGHRRCRRVCRRRCWNPPPPRYEAPVYAPAPQPQFAPRHVAPVQQRRPTQPASHTPVDPALLILLLGGIGIVVLTIFATAASERAAVDRIHKTTEELRQDAAKAGMLATKASTTADEIDRYIADELAKAYDRGRTSPGLPP